jgi:mycothiol system anti-sigma-R factor
VSCGKPHETPCTEVLEDVYIYLDQECDGVSTSKIKQHLEECGPCLQEFGIEQEVKALVARCCGQEVAPDGLRQRLKATLAQVVVTDHETVVEVTSVEVTTVDAHIDRQ